MDVVVMHHKKLKYNKAKCVSYVVIQIKFNKHFQTTVDLSFKRVCVSCSLVCIKN